MRTELPHPVQKKTEREMKKMIMGKREGSVFCIGRNIHTAQQSAPTPANSATGEAIINQMTVGANTPRNMSKGKKSGVKSEEEGDQNPQTST